MGNNINKRNKLIAVNMKLIPEQNKFSIDVARLILRASSMGYAVTLGEAWRMPEQQAIYVKEGKSWTLNSMHLKRLAIDLNFFFADAWIQDRKTLKPLGDYWESLSAINRWGGNYKDKKGKYLGDVYHFERLIP